MTALCRGKSGTPRRARAPSYPRPRAPGRQARFGLPWIVLGRVEHPRTVRELAGNAPQLQDVAVAHAHADGAVAGRDGTAVVDGAEARARVVKSPRRVHVGAFQRRVGAADRVHRQHNVDVDGDAAPACLCGDGRRRRRRRRRGGGVLAAEMHHPERRQCPRALQAAQLPQRRWLHLGSAHDEAPQRRRPRADEPAEDEQETAVGTRNGSMLMRKTATTLTSRQRRRRSSPRCR